MKTDPNLIFTAILAFIPIVQASTSSWTIYHSWNGDQDFSRRGVLEWSEEDETLTVKNDEGVLTKENVKAMMDYGWYHVKIDNGGSDDFVLATVPACNLRRANFKDEFQITFPRTSESLITSLAYTPLISPLAPKTCNDLQVMDSSPKFTSKLALTLDTPGMVLKAVLPNSKPPPGMAFMAHPNHRGDTSSTGPNLSGQQQEKEGEKTFFQKYWYIILFLLIMNIMGPVQPPNQGPPSAQGGGDGGPASAAPAAAPGGAPKQRRGKRN